MFSEGGFSVGAGHLRRANAVTVTVNADTRIISMIGALSKTTRPARCPRKFHLEPSLTTGEGRSIRASASSGEIPQWPAKPRAQISAHGSNSSSNNIDFGVSAV
jgi:hypothetical protein